MPKKPFKFSQLSDQNFCKVCGKGLKYNLLVKIPTADKCYRCHKLELIKKITKKGKLRDGRIQR
jgi:hypothetical protein